MKRLQIIGHRYGWLTVISEAGHDKNGKGLWSCRCRCGQISIVLTDNLKRTNSCGCLQKTRDGLSGTAIGRTWRGMLLRCYHPSHEYFKNYGGRGIKVCEGLRDSPLSLRNLIGERPNGMSIERTDNNGHYSCGKCNECVSVGWPKNVTWATRTEQNRNQRTNRLIEFQGKKQTVRAWSEQVCIPAKTIFSRLYSGWTDEEAIFGR